MVMSADSPGVEPGISLFAVDDHLLVLNGIEAVVEQTPDIRFVGGATTAADAVAQYRALRPDVTLMDVNLPDLSGIEALRRIRVQAPNAKVIILTTYRGDMLAVQAIKAGASGFLLKSTLEMELVEAVRRVHAGERFISAEVARDIALNVDAPGLSDREVDVLKRVAAGGSNKVIGRQLEISEQTVKGHVSRILEKLGAADRAHAVAIAVQRGVLYL